jgi:hypothetical protein
MSNNGASARWKKGQSGNPKGRPKGSGQAIIGLGDSVAFIGRVATDSPVAGVKDGEVIRSTRLIRWTNTLMEKADAGDVRAIRTILGYAAQWDRMQARERAGKPAGKRVAEKGPREGTLTPEQKRKFQAFVELQTAQSAPAAAPKAAPKPAAPPLVDPDPIPDYAIWLKLNPDAARRPPDPFADNRREQAKDQAE